MGITFVPREPSVHRPAESARPVTLDSTKPPLFGEGQGPLVNPDQTKLPWHWRLLDAVWPSGVEAVIRMPGAERVHGLPLAVALTPLARQPQSTDSRTLEALQQRYWTALNQLTSDDAKSRLNQNQLKLVIDSCIPSRRAEWKLEEGLSMPILMMAALYLSVVESRDGRYGVIQNAPRFVRLEPYKISNDELLPLLAETAQALHTAIMASTAIKISMRQAFDNYFTANHMRMGLKPEQKTEFMRQITKAANRLAWTLTFPKQEAAHASQGRQAETATAPIQLNEPGAAD